MTPDQLVAAVRAALDNTERAVAAVLRRAPHWRVDTEPWATNGVGVVDDRGDIVAVTMGDYAARHIARHGPAAVLLLTGALREILDAYEEAREATYTGDETPTVLILEPIVRALARGLGIDPEGSTP